MALKPKRSGLGLEIRSSTGKDGKSYIVFRTGKAKPKAKAMSRAGKPRKSATKSKSPLNEGTVLAGMSSRERATGKPASRLIDQRIRDLGDGAGRPWPACGR